MTYESNLYGGWWILSGAVGAGVALVLVSFGGAWLWLSLAAIIGLIVAAIVAWRMGYGPRRTLCVELSGEGITLLDHPHPPADWDSDLFLAWEQIQKVGIIPRPGYWQVWLQTDLDPESWLLAGTSLPLAENIAGMAGLTRDESASRAANMGTEHYWSRLPA